MKENKTEKSSITKNKLEHTNSLDKNKFSEDSESLEIIFKEKNKDLDSTDNSNSFSNNNNKIFKFNSFQSVIVDPCPLELITL